MITLTKYKILTLASLALIPAALGGCTALGIGVGATAGVAATREGGLSRTMSDIRIQAEINDLWFKYSTKAFGSLDMTVNDGRVLVTGVVQDPEHRVEAIRLAWQPEGVKQVMNEVRIAESDGIKGFARDSWITTRLRAAIVFDKEIQSLNYSIDTVQGTVYLMGSANDQAELDRVMDKARNLPDVQQVVSYVRVPVIADTMQAKQGVQSTSSDEDGQ